MKIFKPIKPTTTNQLKKGTKFRLKSLKGDFVKSGIIEYHREGIEELIYMANLPISSIITD